MRSIEKVPPTDALALPDDVSPEAIQRLQDVLKDSKSTNTLRAYKFDIAHFDEWCNKQGIVRKHPLKPKTIAAYLADSASGCKYATVARRLAALSWLHRVTEPEQGEKLDNPTRAGIVRETMKGLKRGLGVRQTRKAPADLPILMRIADTFSGDLQGLRDRALVLLGYAGAFRRTTLCSLDVADLAFHKDRMDVYIRRDKTSEARTVPITRTGGPYCPVRAVEEWLADAGVTCDAVFRGFWKGGKLREGRLSSSVVAATVKRACEAAGLDPTLYGGHSLRAGHITQATKQGKRIDEIMRITDHHSVEMVMRYIREADPLTGTSATGIWGDAPKGQNCKECGRPLVPGKACRCGA